MRNIIFPIPIIIILFVIVFPAHAQLENPTESGYQGTFRAKVISVLEEEATTVPGTEIQTTIQQIEAEILSGPKKGKIIELENDYVVLKSGDSFLFDYYISPQGEDLYSFQEPDRRGYLAGILILFVLVFLALARMKGLRSLISLAGSLFIIFYLLLPRLAEGSPPVPTSIMFAVLILAVVMFVTHGVNRLTFSAFAGTSVSVVLSSVLAWIAVVGARISGFVSDEAVYLSLNTDGALDIRGIFLAAIIIGAIGVLDDIAVTQASAVNELNKANPDMKKRDLFFGAMNIGKDHVSSLVNTLALAYTGVALPTILLLYTLQDTSLLLLINKEMFAAEIIRTVVGSTGLALAVPVTTLIAVISLKKGSKTQ